MRAILAILLIALVATSTINVNPIPKVKEVETYFNPSKFFTCVKNEFPKDLVPVLVSAVTNAIFFKDFTTLLDVLQKQFQQLLVLGKKCYVESLDTEVQLKNIFGDIGGIIKEIFNDFVSLGKDTWNTLIGDVKDLFDNNGKTLIQDIYQGLKDTCKKILEELLSAAKDTLKN